jgi:WD40 repeat protein
MNVRSGQVYSHGRCPPGNDIIVPAIWTVKLYSSVLLGGPCNYSDRPATLVLGGVPLSTQGPRRVSGSQLLATVQGHTDRVSNAVFSPDGQRIITASQHNTTRVFRVVNSAISESVLAK